MPSNIEKNIAEIVKHFERAKASGVSRQRFEVGSRSDRGDRLHCVLPERHADSWMVPRLAAPHGILIGHLRPLKQARQEGFTAENLDLYFEVSKNVLLKADVAVVNPDFDPELPYSQATPNVYAPTT